jgi:hypothetical protein
MMEQSKTKRSCPQRASEAAGVVCAEGLALLQVVPINLSISIGRVILTLV